MKKRIALVLMSALMSVAVAQEPTVTGALSDLGTAVKNNSVKAWNGTKDTARKVGEKSGEVWDATKKGASDMVDKTKNAAKKTWKKTKEGAGDFSDKSGKAWDATKEGVAKTWKNVKKAYD